MLTLLKANKGDKVNLVIFIVICCKGQGLWPKPLHHRCT